jgi:hypothetical protein
MSRRGGEWKRDAGMRGGGGEWRGRETRGDPPHPTPTPTPPLPTTPSPPPQPPSFLGASALQEELTKVLREMIPGLVMGEVRRALHTQWQKPGEQGLPPGQVWQHLLPLPPQDHQRLQPQQQPCLPPVVVQPLSQPGGDWPPMQRLGVA